MSYIRNCYEKYIDNNKLDETYRKNISHFVGYIENIEHLGDRIVEIHSIHLKKLFYIISEKGRISKKKGI